MNLGRVLNVPFLHFTLTEVGDYLGAKLLFTLYMKRIGGHPFPLIPLDPAVVHAPEVS